MSSFAEEHPEVIKAFHMFWDSYPGVATLVHKSYEIVAANQLAREIGRKPGVICAKLGSPEEHKGCQAKAALKQKQAKWIKKSYPDADRLIFWIPLDGYPDYYVHFSAAIE